MHQEDKRCDWLHECEEQEDDDIQLGSRCERFLDKVLSKLTLKTRFYCFGLSLMCFIGFGLSAIMLKAQEELPAEWVGPNGEVALRRNLLANNFREGDIKLEVKFFVGVSKVVSEPSEYWARDFKGDVIYDEDFDLQDKGTRDSLLNLCHDLSRTDFVVKDSVKCWLSDFDKYW